MANQGILFGTAGSPHNPGDVVSINGEKYVAIKTNSSVKSSEIHFIRLVDFIANITYCSQIPENEMTISDYLQTLADKYESNRAC